MGLLSLNLPIIGQSSATEDQKVRDALAAIQTDYNGNLTDANISATAGIQASKLATGATGLAQGSFSAYRNAALSRLNGEVVQFDTEEFDVSGWFDTATNVGRFTPQVAGYYRLSWAVHAGTILTADVFWRSVLRKNGANWKFGQVNFQRGGVANVGSLGTTVVLANGTTDFFEVTIDHGVGATTALLVGPIFTHFEGEMVGRS